MAALFNDFCFENIECGKYRVQQILAHICDHRGGFVKAISFLAEK